MWILFAIASSFFAGLTAILSKIGVQNTNSHLATALRTTVVLFFSWILVMFTGQLHAITQVSTYTFCFLVLSGISTGASWLCYFRAIQIGEVNKVSAVDKTSTILTIFLAFLFLHETITMIGIVAILFIGLGTWLMTDLHSFKQLYERSNSHWFLYSFGSSFFASLTAIFGKIGIASIPSQLGTAIRTIFVLLFAWLFVFFQGKQKEIKQIERRSWIYLFLSGMTTGISWLCYYRALQDGNASVVVPIDKLSIVVTVLFSSLVLKETIKRRTKIGLLFLILGTFLLL